MIVGSSLPWLPSLQDWPPKVTQPKRKSALKTLKSKAAPKVVVKAKAAPKVEVKAKPTSKEEVEAKAEPKVEVEAKPEPKVEVKAMPHRPPEPNHPPPWHLQRPNEPLQPPRQDDCIYIRVVHGLWEEKHKYM